MHFAFFRIIGHEINYSLLILFTALCCFSGDGQPVFVSLKVHIGKIAEGILSALRTRNQDLSLRHQKLSSGHWDLRPSQVAAGS